MPLRKNTLTWVGLPLVIGGMFWGADKYIRPHTQDNSGLLTESIQQSEDAISNSLFSENKIEAIAKAVADDAKPSGEKPQIMTKGIGSYLAAREAIKSNDNNAAALYLERTLNTNPGQNSLQKEAIKAYSLAGDLPKAHALAMKVLENNGKNQLATMVELVKDIQDVKLDAAKDHLNALDAVGMLILTKPFLAAWIETAQTGTVPTITLNDQLNKSNYFNSFIAYQRALMHDMLNQKDQAREQFTKAVEKPVNLPYRIAVAYMDFLLKHNEKDAALAFCQKWMDANVDNVLTQGMSAQEIVADLKAHHEAIAVTNVAQGVAELMLATANMLYTQESKVETLLYLRFALALRPDFAHAQLLLANMLEDDGNLPEALKTYSAIKGDLGVVRRAGIRKAFTLEAMNQSNEAVTLLSELEKRFPRCSDIAVAQGDILRKLDRFHDAINAYSRALNISSKDSDKQWPLLYVRGISYERAGNWELAEKDFKEALKISPDQPDVLNYLAYSWLTQNRNLEEARTMLERAVAARPDDAHIIDSMGWAYFMLGDYKSAVEYLEQAAELMPGDVTVNEHLGDALWRVGRKHEARFQWQRAITFKPEPEVLDAITKKIADGLPDIASPAVKDAPQSAATTNEKTAANGNTIVQ